MPARAVEPMVPRYQQRVGVVQASGEETAASANLGEGRYNAMAIGCEATLPEPARLPPIARAPGTDRYSGGRDVRYSRVNTSLSEHFDALWQHRSMPSALGLPVGWQLPPVMLAWTFMVAHAVAKMVVRE